MRPSIRGTDGESKKNKLLSSRLIKPPENVEEAEETEIAAQISLPEEGGWGWVVVFSSFWCIFILDGVVFTFGSIYNDITTDLDAQESLVALVNSIAIAIYFLTAPIASAFINRFGFRACGMTGSIICSSTLFCSYFATTITMLCLSYGVIAGIGYCFINMASNLVVGFYFERLRAMAIAISSSGSSAGIMIMSPVNAYLVKLSGWRVTTLFHSGLFGLIYYFSMAYKPLLSFTVMKATDDVTRTVTYLPSLATTGVHAATSRVRSEGITSTGTERLFKAISNVHYPTAAAVVEEAVATSSNQAGTSTAAVSKIMLTANNPRGLNQRQLQQVKSIMSKTTVTEKIKNIETPVQTEQPKKRHWWTRLFDWEEHVPESRPMYRDDAFYDGRLSKLTVYQRSMLDTTADARTGLEYQMAVSRAVTTADLKEKRGVFTTAVRRILATMMDPKLLGKCSFRLLCLSGFLVFVGFLVPYIFIHDRNVSQGADPTYARFCVSVIGFANIIGKLVIGALACKLNPLKLYYVSCMIAGIATMVSNFSVNIYFQYFCCSIFGFFIASLACLRSVLIVELYGLEKLTNATGILLTFQGIGSLISTPTASILKNQFGYSVSFYVAGIALFLSGAVLLPVASLVKKEIK